MKVKKSEIQLLIAVLGVLLVVVTYFLVYAKFNELSDAMESQNMSLRSQVSTLEVLEQRKADYLAATEKMKTYITGFENRFPADILPAFQNLDVLFHRVLLLPVKLPVLSPVPDDTTVRSHKGSLHL